MPKYFGLLITPIPVPGHTCQKLPLNSILLFLAIFGRIWGYSVVFSYIRWYSAVFGGIQRCSAVFDGIWRYLAVFGGIWWYSAVFGGISPYFKVFRSIRRNSAVIGGIPHYYMELRILLSKFPDNIFRYFCDNISFTSLMLRIRAIKSILSLGRSNIDLVTRA